MAKLKSSYSSFWLDKSLFLDENTTYVTDVERKSSDLMKLVSYKRAVSNFVNIVTNKSIPVKFSTRGHSYTDGQAVVIGANVVEPKDLRFMEFPPCSPSPAYPHESFIFTETKCVPVGIDFNPAIFIAVFVSAMKLQCFTAVPGLPKMNLEAPNFILPRDACFQYLIAAATVPLA